MLNTYYTGIKNNEESFQLITKHKQKHTVNLISNNKVQALLTKKEVTCTYDKKHKFYIEVKHWKVWTHILSNLKVYYNSVDCPINQVKDVQLTKTIEH